MFKQIVSVTEDGASAMLLALDEYGHLYTRVIGETDTDLTATISDLGTEWVCNNNTLSPPSLTQLFPHRFNHTPF